ncbi:MAG: WD40 repeat domain-containing protein [Sodalis sp. (in: enterobacteria)]|uniref:WD40 repeat domain-containing protein n=1 Tax=Sodalis sp. (in: enterobacteria) TaxID=1898979 RepID=UPI0039E38392
MTTLADAYGLIAVDKQGSNVLFLDADSYVVQQRLNGFPPRPHELMIAASKMKAYVPLYGDGVHGDNPNPGHKIAVIDLARCTLRGFIDISPLQSPHTGRIGDDGRLYLCCENSRAIVVIDTDNDRVVERIATPSANTHRLTIMPSGKKLFTENEEDASITVVDIAVSPGRVLDTIAMPGPIGGIAAPPSLCGGHGRPALYIVDSDSHQLRGTLPLNDHHHSAQVVRFNHDGSLLASWVTASRW